MREFQPPLFSEEGDGGSEVVRIMVSQSPQLTQPVPGERRTCRGAVLVEAALVLPIVLLFFLGLIEYGRWLMTEHVFNNAVRYGAVYAAKHTAHRDRQGAGGAAVTYGNATTDIQNAVTNDLAGMPLGSQNITVFVSDALGNNVGTWAGGTPGAVRVRPDHRHIQFMIPTMLHLPSS